MKTNNWEQQATKFYEWCIKVGIDMSDAEETMNAFLKIK